MIALIRNICRLVIFGPRHRSSGRSYAAKKAETTAQLRRELGRG